MDYSDSFTERFGLVLREWAAVFMRRSMRDFVQLSKQSGLSMSQMGTLFRLYHGGFCGVSELADHLGVTNAAASQMIDRMVQQGLLERAEDPNDRRAKNISLTPQSRQLVEASIEARRRWIEQLTTQLTLDQQQSISQALHTLTEAARHLESTEITPGIVKT
jgi:DNA-binding MarR family transcriptional regulator